jgi:hypothetical protein
MLAPKRVKYRKMMKAARWHAPAADGGVRPLRPAAEQGWISNRQIGGR